MLDYLNEMLESVNFVLAFTVTGEKIYISKIEKVFSNNWILISDTNGKNQNLVNLSHVVRIEK